MIRILFAFLLMSVLSLPAQAQRGGVVGVSPGTIMNYDMFQMGPFSQPSLFYGPITAKDILPPAEDPNLIQIQGNVMPTDTSLQGIIHTPDGHIYISP
jgi:hypothetical protein